MTQTTYITPVITAGKRRAAYSRFADLFTHIPSFPGVDIVSITRNANNTVTIILTNPLPLDQEAHLGLDGMKV